MVEIISSCKDLENTRIENNGDNTFKIIKTEERVIDTLTIEQIDSKIASLESELQKWKDIKAAVPK